MQMFVKGVFIYSCLVCVVGSNCLASSSDTLIKKILFQGLEETNPEYLFRLIKSKVNTPLSEQLLNEDVQRLYNSRLFFEVASEVIESDRGYTIIFHCQELITTLPIINFGGISENSWFQIGAVDYNFFGRGFTLGAYYRYYDLHSFQVFGTFPYLFSRHWGLILDISKFSTIEPAYFDEDVADYNVDRWEYQFGFRYNSRPNIFFDLTASSLSERYEKNKDRSGENAPGPDLAEFNKTLVKGISTINLVDYYYHLMQGFSNSLIIETVTTEDEPDQFWKWLNIACYYHRLGDKGNAAFRLRTGLSTNKISPFIPFVLDSYINVRGSGNRVARGTGEVTFNAEYRHSIFTWRKIAFQGVGFVDLSGWRPAGGELADMFDDDNLVTFGGCGFRVYIPRLYNLILRLDYGFSLNEPEDHGFVIGTGQYF